MRFSPESSTVKWEAQARARRAEVVTKCCCKLEDLFLAMHWLQWDFLDNHVTTCWKLVAEFHLRIL